MNEDFAGTDQVPKYKADEQIEWLERQSRSAVDARWRDRMRSCADTMRTLNAMRADPLSIAKSLIGEERLRQIDEEGFTDIDDDRLNMGELLAAAKCYLHNVVTPRALIRDADGVPVDWPWSQYWWKPKNPTRDLVRAGALCRAECDRLNRVERGGILYDCATFNPVELNATYDEILKHLSTIITEMV